MTRKVKIIPLLKETYLAQIKNSVGTKMFRNFYAFYNGKHRDLVEDGVFSCAYFVTSILKNFDLIKEVHLTVDSTIEDMKKSGWKKVATKNIKKGDALVWQEKRFSDGSVNRHIGFYLGNFKAVSTDFRKKRVVCHHYTFQARRPIELTFSHKF